ncbi:MAG: right-handed parallel beta-helix repeat-containing protein, partial [Candidatus Hodarchaeales archaeon]
MEITFCYLNVFNVSIVDNYVNNNSLVGMQISASPDNNITDNYINGSVYGFLMNGSNFNLVSENIISNHTYGLYVSWSDNNSFTRNQICNNSQFGCIIDFGADNNTVSGNDIYNNTYLGIHMYGYNNSVNRNNFIDNYLSGISKSQAQDNGSDNVFIFNYWNDWTSPDSDDNGYVDNPYMINGNPGNLDSYPLRYSFKGYIPHLPISITNIIDFSTTYNFPGSGTINNPYLIEGYNFTDGTTDLVYIWSTDAFFIIRNCLMNGVIGTNYGIILEDVENGLMYENTIHSTTYGIRVGSSSKNNTLTNNHIYNNTFGGIILAGTTNNTVYKNTIDNSTVYSVRVLGSDVNTILYNNIRNSSTGVYLEGSSTNNSVSSNIIHDTSRAIFVTQSSDYTNITNNTVYDNDYGIWIQNLAANNNVTANNISDNIYYGIYLSYDSENNTISYNLVSNNNDYGIFLGSNVNDSIIKWNEFIGNNQGNTQGNDMGLNNIFNYNYWDDWTSPDTTPIDGFVDTPYNIDGGSNTDPYPLVYPFLSNEPIYIDENADFATLGFPGDGTSSNPYLIEGYTIVNSTTYSIYIHNTNAHFIIRNNLLDCVTGSKDGILLSNVTNGVIENNLIRNGRNGILFYSYSDNNTVTINAIYNNTLSGIQLTSANNNTILRNTINGYNYTYYGIFLNFSNSLNTITNNTIYNNSEQGINMLGSTNNTVISNTIYNNTLNGIYLDFITHNSTIESNIIYNNTNKGLILFSADDNTIAWNTFITNPSGGPGFSQAEDGGSSNTFKFNYWDHWINPDADGNGIVDNSYSINGSAGNSDPFPLKYPYVHAPIRIDEKSDFKQFGFTGEGTQGNPYLIENIFFMRNSSILIEIYNTTAYFIVRNCNLSGIDGNFHGIYFKNVTHGTIESCTIRNINSGIFLEINITNSIIKNNIIRNCAQGIRLDN